jgi:hypothetical protein
MGRRFFGLAAAASADDAAASADAHVHAAGRNHERQLIAEFVTTALYFKMNNHPSLCERGQRFGLTDGAGSRVQSSLR